LKRRPPAPGTPEFAALQRKWYDRARRSGLDDIETASGDLRGAGSLFVHVPDLDTLEASQLRDPEAPAMSAPYDHLGAAYWRFPWDHPTDRAVCKMLSEGATWAEIHRRLGIDKRKIQAVLRAVRDWADPEAYDD